MNSGIICVFILTICSVSGVFRFAHHYADHMVLQREPHSAILWGFGELDTIVFVDFQGKVYWAKVQQREAGATWLIKLDPQEAGGPYELSASSVVGNELLTISLRDVLFGDIWLCSGQSNMEFTVSMAFTGEEEIEKSRYYPEIRLFRTAQTLSQSPVYEINNTNIEQKWMVASPESVGGPDWTSFSAVCWMFGRRLYDNIGVPIGLLETSWGGTCVEAWSSPSSLSKCNASSPYTEPKNGNSVLWNAMVHPFLNTSIHGVIWYQGEQNAYNPTGYECSFPAMIESWRNAWWEGTQKATNPKMPFGFVQLAGFKDIEGFTDIRWHQTADFCHVPNTKQENTFMAVAVDLIDDKSPHGAIHPRYKAPVADRLLLGALNTVYKQSEVYWTGPIFGSAYYTRRSDGMLIITVLFREDSVPTALVINRLDGFEILLDNSTKWKDVIVDYTEGNRLVLNAPKTSSKLLGLRYAWGPCPCTYKKCTIYSQGSLLPAQPFITYGPFTIFN